MKRSKLIKGVLITFLVTIILVMGSGTTVRADSDDTDDNNNTNTYSYYLDSDTGCLTITGNGTMGNIGVDTKQKGYKFVANRPWALTKANAKKIKSINIGEGITAIPAGAFSNLPNLKKIQMADTVTSIGKYAFYQCQSLSTVKLSNYIKSIGTEAFYGCSKLTSISLGERVSSIGPRAFFGTKSLCSIKVDRANKNFVVKADTLYSKNKKIAYFYASGISGPAKILKTAVRIKSGAFAYGKFSKITIPASVTTVEGGAFYSCKSLKKVQFAKKSKCKILQCYYKNYGNSVSQRLGAFEGCNKLVTFTAPDSLRKMGSSTFVGCKKLKKVFLGKSFQYFLSDKKKKIKNVKKTSLRKVKVVYS